MSLTIIVVNKEERDNSQLLELLSKMELQKQKIGEC